MFRYPAPTPRLGRAPTSNRPSQPLLPRGMSTTQTVDAGHSLAGPRGLNARKRGSKPKQFHIPLRKVRPRDILLELFGVFRFVTARHPGLAITLHGSPPSLPAPRLASNVPVAVAAPPHRRLSMGRRGARSRSITVACRQKSQQKMACCRLGFKKDGASLRFAAISSDPLGCRSSHQHPAVKPQLA